MSKSVVSSVWLLHARYDEEVKVLNGSKKFNDTAVLFLISPPPANLMAEKRVAVNFMCM